MLYKTIGKNICVLIRTLGKYLCVWFCSLVRQIMLFNVTLVKNEHIFWIDINQILVSCKHTVIVTLNNITQPNFCESSFHI